MLHRVIKVTADGYVICGDNRYFNEHGITDRHVIGVLTAIVHDVREIPVTAPGYRLRVRARYLLYPLRSFIRRVKLKLKK